MTAQALFEMCGTCRGEGRVPMLIPLVTHEDATDWSADEERELCQSAECTCPRCHGDKFVPVTLDGQ